MMRILPLKLAEHIFLSLIIENSGIRQNFRRSSGQISKQGGVLEGSFIGHKIDIIKIDIDKHEQMFYSK